MGYLEDIMLLCESTTAIGIIRDVGETELAKELTSLTIKMLGDDLSTGGISAFAKLLELSTTHLTDNSLTAMTNIITACNDIKENTMPCIADGLSSALNGANMTRIGTDLKSGVLGMLPSMTTNQVKYALSTITLLKSNIVTLINEGEIDYAELIISALTGFSINVSGNKFTLIKGVSELDPKDLDIGYGFKEISGAFSGLQQLCIREQGHEVTNYIASYMTNNTGKRMLSAFSQFDKCNAITDYPDNDLIESMVNMLQNKEQETTFRITGLTNIIDNPLTPPSSISLLNTQKNAEEVKRQLYEDKYDEMLVILNGLNSLYPNGLYS